MFLGSTRFNEIRRGVATTPGAAHALARHSAEPLAATALGAVLAGDERVRDVAGLVDHIVGRIGGAAVFRVSSVDNHVPECAQRRCDPLEEPAAFPHWKRPVRLLRRPEPLDGVIALMPDHPPKRFSWRGQARTVVAGDGPERVESTSARRSLRRTNTSPPGPIA